MFARVTELIGTAPESAAQDLQHFASEVLPDIEEIPGMSGGIILHDPDGGRALAIMLYEDAESMANSREQAATLRELVFQRMNLRHAPHVREYEVALARLSGPVGPAEVPAVRPV